MHAVADEDGSGPDAGQLRDIARRFPGRWLQGYVRGKLGSDPVYAAAARHMRTRPAPVLDIGCGIGLLAHYLYAAGLDAHYLGIDIDSDKLRIARSAAEGIPGSRFEEVSCERLPAWQGHVVILDALHYLAAATQQQLLQEAAARVAPGGVLVIRSVLRDSSWRFRITQLEEACMHAIRWMRCRVLHFPDSEELRAPLAAAGLAVQITPAWGHTPFNSYLIVAHRAA